MAVTAAQVTELYLAYFGRPPDVNGLSFYTSNSAHTVASVSAAFSASPESIALYGTSFGAAQINAIYQVLFGRPAEAAGINHWLGQVNSGALTPAGAALGIMNGAQNLDKTAVTNKLSMATLFLAQLDTAAEIIGYSGDAAAASARAFLQTVTDTAASVTAATTALPAAVTAAVAAGQTGGGLNLTLTTGVDNVTGSANNDIITADNTGTNKQLSVADSVNGGNGTDTLKIFLAAADTATGQPTLTSIETVYINGGAVTAYTAATGTTALAIDAASANVAAAYTLSGQDISFSNKTSTAATTTTVAAGATSTHTAQKVTLTAITRDAAANATTIDVTGTKVTTLNLDTTGTASNVALANTGGAAITTINFTGTVGLTTQESAAMAAAVTTVNASTATGALSLDTSAGTVAGAFKFTGGAGNDTLTLANDATGTLISGAQLDGGAGTGDKIGIKDTALTATETARLNQAVNFETLGLNAAITLDASTLTTLKSFAVDTAALTLTINSMATGSTTAINAATTSLTLGTNVGVTDTAITIGGSAGGIVATALVTTGITNVSLTSNGTAANSVTTLTNSDNSVFTLKGAADLTLALAAGTAVGSKVDGSAATGKLTLSGSSIATSGDIVIGGTANDTLAGMKGADTVTGGAGVDTFTFAAAAAAATSGGTFGQADVITDFVVGTDKLQFSGVTDVVSAQQGAVQTAVTGLAAGSSDTAIATAMATANTTNLGVSFAVFNGNTYVLYETTGTSTGVVADDVFIKLTGVATAPTFAADVIA